MNPIAIDSLFQVTAPARTGREAPRSGPAGNDLFRSHLDRAAEASEAKPLATKSETAPSTVEGKTQVEPQADEHQETSTTEQEQVAEVAETPAETTEEATPEEEATDEVTLSAAAVQQAEPVANAEQVVSTEGIVETSFTDGQQQSEGQATTPTTETQNESAGPSTETQAVELETDLIEGATGETTSEEGEASETVQAKALSGRAELQAEDNPSAAATAVEGEVKKPQTLSVSSNAQLPSAKKQSASEVSENLPEAEASESSSKASQGRFEVPVATVNNLAVASAAEFALANINSGAESAVETPNTSVPTSSSETIAAAGRTLGTLLAGKTANASDATAETSTTEAPTVNRARFVNRVSGAIRSAQLREGQIQLRLSPPELGTLRINIVMTEGVLTAHLETETAAARTVLLDNLPALRERLAEQEIRIDKFDVDVGQEGQQQADNPEAEDRQANKNRSQANRSSTRSSTLGLETAESNATQAVSASGLDVRI